MQIVSSSLQMVGISRQEVQTKRSLRMVVDTPLNRQDFSGKNALGETFSRLKSSGLSESGLSCQAPFYVPDRMKAFL